MTRLIPINMLDSFFGDSVKPNRYLMRDTFKLDIEERDNEYVIEADVPGIKKEEIDLNADKENLIISINRAEDAGKDGQNYIHRERSVSSMSRRIRLADVKLDVIKAKLEDGVLTVTIPKNIQANVSRKIEIG